MEFQTIVSIAQGIITLTTLTMIFVKPFRVWLLGIQEQKQQREEEKAIDHEAVRALLRDSITRVYFEKRGNCQLYQYEYKNLSMLYAAYKKMGGNSFVDKIWEEVEEWEILQ